MQPLIGKKAREQLRALPQPEQERLKARIAGLPYEPGAWSLLGEEGEGLYYTDVGRHKIAFLGEKQTGKVHVLDIDSVPYAEISEAEAALAFGLDPEKLAEVKRRLQEQGIDEEDWVALAQLLRKLTGSGG